MRASKKDEFVTRDLAGETILLPVKSGVASLESIYTLNEVARTIWDLIDGERTAAVIADELAVRFDVTLREAQADVSEFLNDLAGAGLVELK